MHMESSLCDQGQQEGSLLKSWNTVFLEQFFTFFMNNIEKGLSGEESSLPYFSFFLH